MMKIKPEGISFPLSDEPWEIPHPAIDCEARFWESVDATEGNRGHLYGTGVPPYAPRGEAWAWGIYVFTCYMRINGGGFFEHYHCRFIDAEKLRQLVYDGYADDIFAGVKFTAQEVPIEKMPRKATLGPKYPNSSERWHLPPDGEKPTR